MNALVPDVSRVAVLRVRALGDLVWSLPAFEALRCAYPSAEITLLGRLHGTPTPVNATLQQVARRLAATGAPPGSMTPDELLAIVTEASSDVPG